MNNLVGRKPHVLLVEDNPGDVELLRLALGAAEIDCELMVIDDGGEALALVRQQGKYSDIPVPDLAILDLNIPKNDGLEILAAIRTNQPFENLPVAILSSSPWLRERAILEPFHISRYITKPADLDEFLSIGMIVKELLSEPK